MFVAPIFTYYITTPFNDAILIYRFGTNIDKYGALSFKMHDNLLHFMTRTFIKRSILKNRRYSGQYFVVWGKCKYKERRRDKLRADINNIYQYVDTLGIKHGNLGFRYLVALIQIGIETYETCYKISNMYEKVAKIYGTNRSSVERAVRYSIKSTKYKGMTNKEFVMVVIDDITFSTLKPN